MAPKAGRSRTREFSSLSASIVTTLKDQIVQWRYPPEYRMTEAELCKQFGVSRSPVREALRILATDGFVQRMPNRSYRVKQHNLQEIEELYDVRLALELFVVEQLANRSAPGHDDIAALKRTWTSVLNGLPRKDEELARLDTQFHETLALAAGNKTLLRQLRAINERLMLFRIIDFAKAHRATSTCRQHLAILTFILAKNSAGARKAMQKNIEEGRNNVQSAIKDALARAYSL
ncbi:MAG: GntR family transcriptional regulator [Nitrospira sp.]|nr:GntR family transcriptional regulator [Nitrospira sp.]